MLACGAAAALLLTMPEPGRPRGGGWNLPRPSVPREIRADFARVAVTGASVWAVVALFFSVVPSFATERMGTHSLALLGAISSIVLICSSRLAGSRRETASSRASHRHSASPS